MNKLVAGLVPVDQLTAIESANGRLVVIGGRTGRPTPELTANNS